MQRLTRNAGTKLPESMMSIFGAWNVADDRRIKRRMEE